MKNYIIGFLLGVIVIIGMAQTQAISIIRPEAPKEVQVTTAERDFGR